MSSGYTNSAIADLAGSDHSNLYSVIDRDNVYGLNLAVPEAAKTVIKSWDQRDDTSIYADSGVDDQVIIYIPFSQNVRLRSLLLKLGRGETTPCRLRIYANHPHIIDFADVDSTKPHLDIRLLEGEAGVTEYPLRVAAFASINTLSLFFSDSVGGDVTRMYYIGLKGDTTSPRKDASSKLEIPAANAADASLMDRLSEKSASQQTTAR